MKGDIYGLKKTCQMTLMMQVSLELVIIMLHYATLATLAIMLMFQQLSDYTYISFISSLEYPRIFLFLFFLKARQKAALTQNLRVDKLVFSKNNHANVSAYWTSVTVHISHHLLTIN